MKIKVVITAVDYDAKTVARMVGEFDGEWIAWDAKDNDKMKDFNPGRIIHIELDGPKISVHQHT